MRFSETREHGLALLHFFFLILRLMYKHFRSISQRALGSKDSGRHCVTRERETLSELSPLPP